MIYKRKRADHYFAAVVALLFFQFLIRAHNITAQNPFMDEGFHAERAEVVWHFQVNPGQFSDGKLLLYYWLGIFQGSRTTAIFTGRESMALFSLLTGAMVYLLGRKLFDARVGLLALTLYCVFPMTLFHDRMAMSDSFASGFSCLAVWSSLVFIRHPTRRQSVILGICLALATFAKLSLVLLPIVTLAGSFMYLPVVDHETLLEYWKRWRTVYRWPFIIAAMTVIVCWLPILLPAYVAQQSGHPFSLLDSIVFSQSGDFGTGFNTWAYLTGLFGIIADYTSPGILIVGLVATIFLLRTSLKNYERFWSVAFLLFWLLSVTLSWLAIAAQLAARYAVPAIPPALILLSAAIVSAWEARPSTSVTRHKRPFYSGILENPLILKLCIITLTALWVITFVIPFDLAEIFNPINLPIGYYNYTLFISPEASADPSTVQAGLYLDTHSDASQPVYADWRICRLLWFTIKRPIQCLDRQTGRQVNVQIEARYQSDVQRSSTGYIVVSGPSFGPNFARFNTICSRLDVLYLRPRVSDLEIWKFTAGHCPPIEF